MTSPPPVDENRRRKSPMRELFTPLMTSRSALAAAAIAIGTIGIGLVASRADDAKNDQIIDAAGKTNDKSFCGTKPIILGIHDGFGINGCSKTSMAAVRSEAAKCPNVKQMVRIGQGDLQKSITDVNDMVAQGINALVLIPDFGTAQLPSIKAATAERRASRWRIGLCRPSPTKATSSFLAAQPATLSAPRRSRAFTTLSRITRTSTC